MSPADKALVERLRRTRKVYNVRGTFRDEIVNVDGTAAADRIEALSAPAGVPDAVREAVAQAISDAIWKDFGRDRLEVQNHYWPTFLTAADAALATTPALSEGWKVADEAHTDLIAARNQFRPGDRVEDVARGWIGTVRPESSDHAILWCDFDGIGTYGADPRRLSLAARPSNAGGNTLTPSTD